MGKGYLGFLGVLLGIGVVFWGGRGWEKGLRCLARECSARMVWLMEGGLPVW